MQIWLNGKAYYPKYIPFFRMRQPEKSARYYKYGIRYPSGRIEYIFFDKDRDQIQQMKATLLESLKVYALQDPKFLNEFERRMRLDVRELFQIRD